MSRPRRIWHLLSNRWNSAITEYALSAARALQARGHETLFTPLVESPAEDRAKQHLLCESVPKFSVTNLPRLFELADTFRPEQIVTYGGPETFLASLLKRGRDVQIFRFRGQSVDGSGLGAGLKHRLSHRFVETIITPSQSLAEAVRGLDASAQVVCVPLGIDVELYRRVAVEKPKRPTLVIFGRLDPIKGHQTALRIMVQVLRDWPRDLPRPRLYIVGQPANLSATHIESWIKDLGLSLGDDVVLIYDRIANVAELMSQTTLGWVPSVDSEIICRVAEEFLACGTPVAVSGVGSLEEVLFEGAGFSYHGKTEDEAARLLAAWLQASMTEGEAAKKQRAEVACQLYSFASMGEALDDVLGC